MAAADEASVEPLEVLVGRAGAAVARAAAEMMGGTYGRRVVVVAGKGNNGADGRAAAAWLARRGVWTEVVDAVAATERLPACDRVVDAAYGTGFQGEYVAPDPGAAPVLAVDIPSGVDGLTGRAGERAVRATRTVTFAALKPGLLLSSGPDLAGETSVVDIGLALPPARAHLVEAPDVAGWLPSRPRDTHKWASSVWVVAGSPGMTGAASLACRGAMRAGAGLVRLGTPGEPAVADGAAPEVLRMPLPEEGWDADVLGDLDRFKALVVGPGLGRSDSRRVAVRRLLSSARDLPVVVDADGLYALGSAAEAADVIGDRQAATVLTPHAGEFARLAGAPPAADRLASARDLAAATGATVLLKGSTTVVADPDGAVLLSNSGGPRLATAGTGDVLAGIIGAFLAQGLDGLRSAGAAAFVHGAAGALGWPRGLVAGDLPELLPVVLSSLC
ncbi:MAG: NAD(P)H-hydrate dehydratase [Acidimicrobiales bacterium]